MNNDIISRGRMLYNSRQINISPFRTEFFYVVDKYDLQCLASYLKSITVKDLVNQIDWSIADSNESNYTLLSFVPGDGSRAGFHVLYAPIMRRMVPGDFYLGLLARFHTTIVTVCMESAKSAGYDPTEGSVMLGQLIAQAFFSLCILIGVDDQAVLTFVQNDRREFLSDITPHQWEYVSSLSELALYSAARDMNQTLENNTVIMNNNGWKATTYFS